MPFRSPAAMLSRKCLGAALLLLLCTALPVQAGDFIDAAGRRVVIPERIGRVMPADRTAEVLVLVLAPEKLAGFGREPRRGDLPPRFGRVPVIDWGPDGNPAKMAEAAWRLHPQLIIDASGVTPERAAYADQVQQLTGVPYILVDDSFPRTPQLLRSVGTILGVADRAADLGIWAEHAIAGLRGRLLIRPTDTRPHVYYGRGPSGLETALPGSPSGEALDEAGAINVAGALGRGARVAVTPAQLFAWNPTIIIAEDRRFYAALQRDRRWRRLAAVANGRVYLEPENPFGWIDDPPGVNRLIGLYWLSGLFYPDETQEDLRTVTCDFYQKFYGEKLTNAQLEALVRPAGAKPPETNRPIGEPLVGLGAAPPLTLAAPPTATLQPSAPQAATPQPTTPQPATPAMPSMNPPAQQAAATCTGPTAPGAPLAPLPQATTNPDIGPLMQENAPVGTPGVPPPGRRGYGRTPGAGTPGVPAR
jgi:iron complex transport system substrate-binding protein